MNCTRTSTENEWRNMGKAAAHRGYPVEKYADPIKNAAARASFIEGYEEQIEKMARAAKRASKADGR